MATENLQIPDIAASQNQKEVTANAAHNLLDRALNNDASKDISGDTAFTTTETRENIVIELTGTPGAPHNINMPDTNSRFMAVVNNTDGIMTIRNSASGGTGQPVIAVGEATIFQYDGTNFFDFTDLAISAANLLDLSDTPADYINASGRQVTVNAAANAVEFTAQHAKIPVRAATTVDITLSGEQTLDGVLTSADRVLVKDQTLGEENGLYLTAAGAWVRTLDFDDDADVIQGVTIPVAEGAIHGRQVFVLTTAGPYTLGTTVLAFPNIVPTFDAGTVGTPAIRPTGDPDTGFFFPTADEVAMSVGGSEAWRTDSAGSLLLGHTAALTTLFGQGVVQLAGLGGNSTFISQLRFANNNEGAAYAQVKSRGTTIGAADIVQDDDICIQIFGMAADGVDFNTQVVKIQGRVDDAAPAADSIGGTWIFSTARGLASDDMTEAMRITNQQSLLIGHNAPIDVFGNAKLMQVGDGEAAYHIIFHFGANANGPAITLGKSRGASPLINTIVNDNDSVGNILFQAADGGDFDTQVAQIRVRIDDASPAVSSIGGDLGFLTARGLATDDITLAMLIDNRQRILIAAGNSLTRTIGGNNPNLQVTGIGGDDSAGAFQRFSANASAARFSFGKSRGASPGTYTIVVDSDVVGDIDWHAADGADMATVVARIQGVVDDASPAANSIGGALILSTGLGAGDDDLTESMRLFANGDIRLSAGTAALATGATGGFPGMPTMAGDASAAPTHESPGFASFLYDTTNQEFKIYDPVLNEWRFIATTTQ